MGFLETIKNIGNGAIFNIAIPNSEGILFTNSSYNQSQAEEYFGSTSQSIFSDYALVAKTGNNNTFYAVVKKDGIETEYEIITGSSPATNIIVKYDPSDNQPSFIYQKDSGIYKDLYYLKLYTNNIWSGVFVGALGPSVCEDAIDLEYDPKDNLPACIAYDTAGYDLNYFKFNGTNFIKTNILNGTSISNFVSYANLRFDLGDNYPMINYIEGDSSIIKSVKYNGTSWTTTDVNTFDPQRNKRNLVTEFYESVRQPMIFMAGPNSGLYMNVRNTSNIWKSGKFNSYDQDTIYNQPEIKISTKDKNDVYISYLNNANSVAFIKATINHQFDSSQGAFQENFNQYPTVSKFVLASGNSITNKKPILEIDSDQQPVVFFRDGNYLKYVKNTGSTSLTNQSFSGIVNFKNIKNLNDANNEIDLEFFKDTFQVYFIGGSVAFYEYKYPYQKATPTNIGPAVNTWSMNIKINPNTKEPNCVGFHFNNGPIRFYYPTNPQRTSWAYDVLPSGDIYFSGNNILPASLNSSPPAVFDFDQDTNQPIIFVRGTRGSNISGAGFLLKKDLVGSGYQYYNTPFTGYGNPAAAFGVNPVTKKYCLALASYDGNDQGIIYCEMDPTTNSWSRHKLEDIATQHPKLYLHFKPNGNVLFPYVGGISAWNISGRLTMAEYDGVSWSKTYIDSGAHNNYYYNNSQYNSGEDYWGIAYRPMLSYSGFYATNKGGPVKIYNVSGNQSSTSRMPWLLFKKYRGEVRPFVYMYFGNAGGYFHYLQNDTFITGEFKNDLIPDDDGGMILRK